MPATVRDLLEVLDRLCPFRLAYDWDNVGLQVGDPSAVVERVAIGLEVNQPFLDFAASRDCQLLLVHHPLIFSPLKALRYDTLVGALVAELVAARRALIVAHTNLDRVLHGTAAVIAQHLALRHAHPLEPAELEPRMKFVVFVPKTHTPAVIEAIHRGGGGIIGNYSHCTFRSPGTGTYVPESGANPYQGTVGKFEEAEEDRLEAVVPRRCIRSVLREVLAVHPYEEVAYDIYPLIEGQPSAGLGLVGELERPSTVAAIAECLARACGVDHVSLVGRPSARVRRVAIVTGSAGSSVDHVGPADADLFITGELNYHRAAEAKQRGLNVLCVGHAASEKLVAPHLAELLRADPLVRQSGVELHVFTKYEEPFTPLSLAASPTRQPKTRRRKA
ncbi:MAG: Nif3-like dinuclear metal center hexameric protein [Candidatus Hydrogenedentota bacterium]|nr:Nif3-like dinuclear metal center hexameric protein [Candidatus Sumerlaea chitinivorans]RMH25808.1 MAG: Nif3-like dinuclear metal center hexameric protein [Candidatus Hydrogenedentota bacterium]